MPNKGVEDPRLLPLIIFIASSFLLISNFPLPADENKAKLSSATLLWQLPEQKNSQCRCAKKKLSAQNLFLLTGKLALNCANSQELELLEGIGRKRAKKIMRLKKKLKKPLKLNDLLKIKGIGQKRLAKIAKIAVENEKMIGICR